LITLSAWTFNICVTISWAWYIIILFTHVYAIYYTIIYYYIMFVLCNNLWIAIHSRLLSVRHRRNQYRLMTVDIGVRTTVLSTANGRPLIKQNIMISFSYTSRQYQWFSIILLLYVDYKLYSMWNDKKMLLFFFSIETIG